MFGWLRYESTEDAHGLTFKSIEVYPFGDAPIPAFDLPARQHRCMEFLTTVCAHDPPARVAQMRKDFLVYIHYVFEDDLGLAMHVCRAHHRLPAEAQRRRREKIDQIIDTQFSDIRPIPKALADLLSIARTLAVLMPDALMENSLMSDCLSACAHWLYHAEKGLARPAAYATVGNTLRAAEAFCDRKKYEPTEKKDLLDLFRTLLLLCRPGDRSALAADITSLLSGFRVAYLRTATKALTKHGVPIDHPAHFLATEKIIRDLTWVSDDQIAAMIDAHAEMTMAELLAMDEQAFRATIDFVDRNPGSDEQRIQASEHGLNIMRTDGTAALSNLFKDGWTVLHAQSSNTAEDGAKEPGDIDRSDWSIEQLARWIEGPIAETNKSPLKLIDKKSIVERLQGQAKLAEAQRAKANPKSSPVKAMAGPTVDDVGRVAQMALDATASYLLADLKDLQALSARLKLDGVIGQHCAQLTQRLNALRAQSSPDELKMRTGLAEAETAIDQMRSTLRAREASALARQRFAPELNAALNREPMVLGKRSGGAILCGLQIGEWGYVNQDFHNRWLPRYREITVGENEISLGSDRALALYVTFGSLSGALFDISVHLWQRRAGATSPPSTEAGMFPPMNEQDWYDTHATCCVLHIPATL